MKALVLALMFFSVLALAFVRAFGQENAPYHMTNVPGPTDCAYVPIPMMTEPVPGGTPTVVPADIGENHPMRGLASIS